MGDLGGIFTGDTEGARDPLRQVRIFLKTREEFGEK
jgi:hypothetical protein